MNLDEYKDRITEISFHNDHVFVTIDNRVHVGLVGKGLDRAALKIVVERIENERAILRSSS